MSLRHLLALTIILVAITGCNSTQLAAAQSRRIIIPNDMQAALAHEYGRYEDLDTWAEMMNALQNADVVCIGEAHYDARDMETAFEIARGLAQRREIVLAVERFSYDMQSALERLNLLNSPDKRAAEVEALIQDKGYQAVWGTRAFNQTGYPVNTPSKPIFESMVKWAARAQIPLIALDVSLADRKKGLDMDMGFRNELWKEQVEKFLANHPHENYQVVVIGGINHMLNAPDSFPSKMKSDSGAKVISIGQRDAMYHYLNSIKVETLAKTYSFEDLIIRQPQFALVNVKGIATFPAPPDYWIAVHMPARWESQASRKE